MALNHLIVIIMPTSSLEDRVSMLMLKHVTTAHGAFFLCRFFDTRAQKMTFSDFETLPPPCFKEDLTVDVTRARNFFRIKFQNKEKFPGHAMRANTNDKV